MVQSYTCVDTYQPLTQSGDRKELKQPGKQAIGLRIRLISCSLTRNTLKETHTHTHTHTHTAVSTVIGRRHAQQHTKVYQTLGREAHSVQHDPQSGLQLSASI